MINTLPIDINQSVTMRIRADITSCKGGIPYGTIFGALLPDISPRPVIVDVTSGHYDFGRSHSDAKIRLSEGQKRFLAARIDYSAPLGMLTPKKGRFVIDPFALPTDSLKVDWGNQYEAEPEWSIEVTLPIGVFVNS